jgi:hypothetical protein
VKKQKGKTMIRKLFSTHALGVLVMTVGMATVGYAESKGDPNPGHLRMALVNMKSLYSNSAKPEQNQATIQRNLERHLYFIDKAVGEGAEFVGFPELSVNGYAFGPNMTWLKLDGPEVRTLAEKAKEKKLYVSAGIAEIDDQGKKWNTQFILGPDGNLVGKHHKVWLTKETGVCEVGTEHNVFDVKGTKVGISTCADGSDYYNLKKLVDNGAKIIYGPHANTTGGTIAKWYNFRAKWGGQWDGKNAPGQTSNNGPQTDMPSGGWINQLKVHAALHNHAGLFNPEFAPPPGNDSNTGWASGSWFIGPDGQTLAQMPPSGNKADSKEFLLIHNVPIQ